MTNEQIQDSINTGFLSLTFKEKMAHYSIVYMSILLGIFFLGYSIYKSLFNGKELDKTFLIPITAISIGAIFYFIQKSRLRFKVINSNIGSDELKNVLKKTGQELEWRIELKNEKVIVARTSPSFFSGSWGEQITIILNGNKILINSICDTRKRDSLISAGRNTKNMNTIIKNIKKPVTNNI